MLTLCFSFTPMVKEIVTESTIPLMVRRPLPFRVTIDFPLTLMEVFPVVALRFTRIFCRSSVPTVKLCSTISTTGLTACDSRWNSLWESRLHYSCRPSAEEPFLGVREIMLPQSEQNLLPSGLSNPQLGHFTRPSLALGGSPRLTPQPPQNLWPSGFSKPHFGHFISIAPTSQSRFLSLSARTSLPMLAHLFLDSPVLAPW
jgi:hypothetical protein